MGVRRAHGGACSWGSEVLVEAGDGGEGLDPACGAPLATGRA